MSGWAVCAAIGLLTLLVVAHAADGETRRDVKCAVRRPIAPRGGVILLPLSADKPGPEWPETLVLSLADGRTVNGVVAWIHRRPVSGQTRPWNAEPRQLAIRPIEPADDTSIPGTGRPVLMARLPKGAVGPIGLGSQSIDVLWREIPDPTRTTAGLGLDPEQLVLSESMDRPALDSPFAFWRWVMLARRLRKAPPPMPEFDPIESMLAEHEATMWLMAVDRLTNVSPGVAGLCVEILTRTCRDELGSAGWFAAWETDSPEIARLLATLLDFSRDDDEVADLALAWADDRDPLLVWVEAGYGDTVRLALANSTPNAPLATFSWISDADDIPIAEQLDPENLGRIAVSRPALPDTAGIGLPLPERAGDEVLLIESDGRSRQFTFGPRVAVARPPSAFFQTLKPVLRLFEVRAQVQQPAPADRACTVELRKRQARWELFFDCRRPSPTSTPGDDSQTASHRRSSDATLSACPDWRQTAGVEAVTVLIGPEEDQGGPSIALTVPEAGWHRFFRGSNDGTMQVHRRSYPDRWLCRIVLPDSWLFDPSQFGEPVLLGVMRTHGDSDLVQTAPNPAVPWRAVPSRAAIDLMQWDAASTG